MKILLLGFGAMNQRVAQLGSERGHEIVGVITKDKKNETFPSFSLEDELPEADVVIDFSHPDLSLRFMRKNQNIPLVVATTGKKEQLLSSLAEVAKTVPVFYSANMSYGIHVLTEIIKYSVPLLPEFDIELTEKHHRKKMDAPSGTLIKILEAVQEKRRETYPTFDRTTRETPRDNDEIGVNVIRGGTIVGEHEVLFAGLDETIEITHRAYSKDIFANGSLDVAEKLVTKKAGMYTFVNL